MLTKLNESHLRALLDCRVSHKTNAFKSVVDELLDSDLIEEGKGLNDGRLLITEKAGIYLTHILRTELPTSQWIMSIKD